MRVTVNFTEVEVEEIEDYLQSHRYRSRSDLIRQCTMARVRGYKNKSKTALGRETD